MTEKSKEVMCTIVDDVALRTAIRMWARMPTLLGLAEKGQDLYLYIIAHATGLPYETVYERFQYGDHGINEARRKVKRRIFALLTLAPTSVLQVHDEQVVIEGTAVPSLNGLQDLANRPR